MADMVGRHRGVEISNLLKLPTWADDEHVFTVVEAPRGSSCKLDFDPDLRVFMLAKPLMAGLAYPHDCDPLDVLVVHDAQTYRVVSFDVHLSGFSKSSRGPPQGGTTVRSRCRTAPHSDRFAGYIRHLPSRAREELEQLFRAMNALEKMKLEFLGWRGATAARNDLRRLAARTALDGHPSECSDFRPTYEALTTPKGRTDPGHESVQLLFCKVGRSLRCVSEHGRWAPVAGRV